MKKLSPAVWVNWLGLILGAVLFAAACTAIPVAEGQPQANLTAQRDVVMRTRGEESGVEVPANTAVDIQENDQVTVDEEGRGLLRFPSGLLVEIFRDTTLQLGEIRLDPGDILFVRLRQIAGHTYTDLGQQAAASIIVTTDFATITSLQPDTKFALCHDPQALTCLVVLEGKTEVEAQGKIVSVNGGESTYIFPGMPPKDPICADITQVEQWLDQKRASADLPALGELVSEWPEAACGPQAEEAASPIAAEPALPPAHGMVRIEEGVYEVGRSDADELHLATQQVSLSAYWIDVHEVSNGAYQAYLEATAAAPPVVWPGLSNHPVQGVTWNQAAAYCAWANKRLPSEAEWEAAARGPDSPPPLYPWGPDPLAGNQANSLPRAETYPVGSFPFNVSPFGVFDMAGNVWEWVGDSYGPPLGSERILRGGRHGFLTDMAYRQLVEPDSERFVPFAGFRCAADRVEGE
jgi:formylglycine-generating enzyme required for sulfatase activity